jgi:DNA-binding IclR family transcriptional regulator
LREELEDIHTAGFAVNDQELTKDLYAIAAPIRNDTRETVAAVNLTANTNIITLEELVDALGPHLTTTADRISARLGYRRNDETN